MDTGEILIIIAAFRRGSFVVDVVEMNNFSGCCSLVSVASVHQLVDAASKIALGRQMHGARYATFTEFSADLRIAVANNSSIDDTFFMGLFSK